MAKIISFTCIPDDGIGIEEIQEFQEILDDMLVEMRAQQEQYPDNIYRLYIMNESAFASLDKSAFEAQDLE